MAQHLSSNIRQVLERGTVIPASPLALTAERTFDQQRQRALFRYYAAAGAGGIAVGVHTTQFAIRDPNVNLFRPVLTVGAEEMDRADRNRTTPLIRIGGVCGQTDQAVTEAGLLNDLGYHAGLLSLAAMADATDEQLIEHCRSVAGTIPVVGFYLQPAVGGRVLGYDFWKRFCDLDNVVAIKIAPFNRYRTIDVVRAVVDAGRDNIAIYTGNDDNIVADLLTPYRFEVDGQLVERRIVGGLLGHWSVWTKAAVDLLAQCHDIVDQGGTISSVMLQRNIEVTDCNAAVFDVANDFAGCIAGVHEVLRRQGLLAGTWCLDPEETLSPGQADEITRVASAYPHLTDDQFVADHLDQWLEG